MHRERSTTPDVARIPLYRRGGAVVAYTLVDASDAALVNQHRWFVLKSKTLVYAGRWVRAGQTFTVRMLHRFILGLPSGRDLEVDHINRDGLDNRRANLRAITHAGNMQNRPSHKGSRSRYRGVSWDSARKRWRAKVRISGRTVHLGRFLSEEEAGETARLARLRLMPFAVD